MTLPSLANVARAVASAAVQGRCWICSAMTGRKASNGMGSQSTSFAPSSQRRIVLYRSKYGSASNSLASSADIGPPWNFRVVLEPALRMS